MLNSTTAPQVRRMPDPTVPGTPPGTPPPATPPGTPPSATPPPASTNPQTTTPGTPPSTPPTPAPGTPPSPPQPPLDSQVDPTIITAPPPAPTPPPNNPPPVTPPAGIDQIEVKGDMHISRIATTNGYGHFMTLWKLNPELQAKRKNPHKLFHGDLSVPQGDIVKLPKPPTKTEPAQTEQVNPFEVDNSQLFLRLKILDETLKPVGTFPYELNIGGKVIRGKIGEAGDGLIQQEIPKTATFGTLLITLPAPPAPPTAAPAPGATPPASPPTPAPGTPPSALVNPAPGTPAPGTPAPGTPPSVTPTNPATPPTTPPAPEPEPGPDQIKFTLHIGRLDPIQELAPDSFCLAGVQARLNNLAFDCGKVDGVTGAGVTNAIKRYQRRMSLTPEDGLPSAAVQESLFNLHDTAQPGPPVPVVPAAGETAANNDQTIV